MIHALSCNTSKGDTVFEWDLLLTKLYYSGSLAVAKRNLLWKLPIWLSKNLQKRKSDFFTSHVHNKWILDQYDQCLHDNPGSKLWMEKMYLVELRGGGMISGWQWFPFKDSLLLKRSPIRIHVNFQRLQNFTCSCDVKSATLFQLLKDTAVESLRFRRDDKIQPGALKLGVQKLKMNNKSIERNGWYSLL